MSTATLWSDAGSAFLHQHSKCNFRHTILLKHSQKSFNLKGYEIDIHTHTVWRSHSRDTDHTATLTYKLEEVHQHGDCQAIDWISMCIVFSDS